MSNFEEAWLRRISGRRLVARSLTLGLAGAAPLLLYVAFGPADGNPIGLGLLAVVTVPVAALGAGIGVIKLLVERYGGDGR